MRLVRAAGGIVWRMDGGQPRVAVVHRPRRGDWSLPKGKLAPGEAWHAGALREIAEETGCAVRLGRFAGAKLQLDRPEPKLTLYWHARLLREGPLPSQDEVDEVVWLPRRAALERLDRASDRRLLVRALAVSVRTALRPRPGPGGLAPDLGGLVVVDSPRAEAALPSVLAPLARAVAGACRLAARRA